MKKLLVAMIAAAVLLSASGAVFAAPAPPPSQGGPGGYAWRACYDLMWDLDGNFLSRDAFSKRLDVAVKEGFIRAGDKPYGLEMYDYCAANGGRRGGGPRGGGRYGGGGYHHGGGCCGW